MSRPVRLDGLVAGYALCPRVAVMAAGRMLAEGATGEVLSRPDVVAAYLGEAA